MSYRLRRGLVVFANASNLTNQPQLSYSGYSRFVEDVSFSGRKFTVGVELDF